MRKIVIYKPGGYDRLRLEEHPDPMPGADQVRVQVDASGVNYADCVVRMGLYASAKEFVGWPITPGFEVAGRVDALGAEVGDLKVGQEVISVTRFGGYASQVCVPRHQVFERPTVMSVLEAASFPAVHATAWYALFDLVRLRPGDKLLVHSAAGGVGGALLSLGKLAGCSTVGVVGASHKVEAARTLGADHVIDKSREPLWPTAERYAPDGYDVVLDANGVSTMRQSYRHVATSGKLVLYGFHSMFPRKGGRPNYFRLALDFLRTPRFNPIDLCNQNKSVISFNLSYLFDQADRFAGGMRQLLGWAEAGELPMPSVQALPAEEVARAHAALESGQTVGKLVLTW